MHTICYYMTQLIQKSRGRTLILNVGDNAPNHNYAKPSKLLQDSGNLSIELKILIQKLNSCCFDFDFEIIYL